MFKTNMSLLNKIKIKNKLILAFLFLSLIIIFTLSFTFMNIARKSIEEEVSKSSLKTLEQITNKIKLLVDNIINISNLIYVNHSVTISLKTNDKFEQSRYDTTLKEEFFNYRYVNDLIEYNITIYGKNGKTYEVLSYESWNKDDRLKKAKFEDLKKEPWYDEVMNNDGVILWYSEQKDNNIFYAIRQVKDGRTGDSVGILIIDFEERMLRNIYMGNTQKDSSDIFIINNNGKIISRENMQSQFAKIGDSITLPSDFNTGISGYYKTQFDHKDMLVLSSSIDNINWKVIQYIPLETLMSGLNSIQYYIVFIALVCFILTSILAYIIAIQISSPLRKLSQAMGSIQLGNFNIPPLELNRQDEIGLLNIGFNRMTNNLRNLMNNLVEEQEHKRKAELNFLQAQINPHFLYNTLSSIRFMLKVGDQNTADEMIIALVKILKKTLNKSDELITIEDEIETLKNYVFIQQNRYNQFSVSYDIDESLLNYRMIKLTLQPLVENSVFHAFRSSAGKGNVKIIVKKAELGICIQVKDDGEGMKVEIVDNLLRDLNSEVAVQSGGLGLKSVQNRILLHFKKPYGLTVESSPHVGTTIDILIPAIRN